MSRAHRALGLLTLLAMLVSGRELAAQTAGEVREACVEGGGAPARCADAAVAARALMGQVGLLAGGGSEVPGAASTLGRRLGSTPRTAVSLRLGGIGAGHPDLAGAVVGPGPEVSYFVPSVQGSVALGLTDGLAPMPTVGGLLALDVLAQADLIFLPESKGFGGGTAALTLGARLGLVRESFTLPGVSVSVARRFIGAFDVDGGDSPEATRLELDPAVTSVRATVGKDLFAVGVLAGLGWDFYSADGVLDVSDGGSGVVDVQTSLEASRRLIFVGASLSFVVLQISAEGGWAQGFDPMGGYAGAPFDATKGSAFGGLSVRLIL